MKNYLLWENGAPGFDPSIGQAEPSVDAYIIEDGKEHSAVIVCPGGGYTHRAEDHEGKQVCEFLNSHGINAFMLKYRLRPYRYPIELYDVQRAIRFVRYNAEKFGVISDKIGVLGFSAGGHLSVMAIEHYDYGRDDGDEIDRVSCRPDAGVLCYAVCSLEKDFGHVGCAINLLGEETYNNDKELVTRLSGENSVRDDCPPVFLWHTAEDDCVNVANSIAMATALREKKIPYELHIFPYGDHGLGFGLDRPGVKRWSYLLAEWLGEIGF
ncbi:MAG: alpha/beta hydrolase [Clostridia bacterium]|nr:alpha/beta hydrolase [Clostridia bacterium]